MTLTEFLLARIAEDEADARAADSSRWLAEDKGVTFEWRADDFHDGEAQARLTADTKANMWHISNWAPARVLAECEAKRRIVDDLEDERQRKDIYNRDFDLGLLTTDGDFRGRLSANARWAGLEVAVRALASVYADHPDYRDEWKP